MISNATDTPRAAPFDIFVPQLISVAFCSGEAALWRTLIPPRFMLLLAIFAVVIVLISSEQRSAITRVLERNFFINA
jgi:hypothetical protein